jgi:S1-C subfamily serine protease
MDAARIRLARVAVGRPGRKVTASFGIVSAISTTGRARRAGASIASCDSICRSYDGFSGGSLVDSNGAVIGIDNWRSRETPTALPASHRRSSRRRAARAQTFAGRSSGRRAAGGAQRGYRRATQALA